MTLWCHIEMGVCKHEKDVENVFADTSNLWLTVYFGCFLLSDFINQRVILGLFWTSYIVTLNSTLAKILQSKVQWYCIKFNQIVLHLDISNCLGLISQRQQFGWCSVYGCIHFTMIFLCITSHSFPKENKITSHIQWSFQWGRLV